MFSKTITWHFRPSFQIIHLESVRSNSLVTNAGLGQNEIGDDQLYAAGAMNLNAVLQTLQSSRNCLIIPGTKSSSTPGINCKQTKTKSFPMRRQIF